MRARQDARQLSLDVFVFIFVTVTTKEPPLRDATSPDGYAAIYIYILWAPLLNTHHFAQRILHGIGNQHRNKLTGFQCARPLPIFTKMCMCVPRDLCPSF